MPDLTDLAAYYRDALDASDLWDVWPTPPVLERPAPRQFTPDPDEEPDARPLEP
jgi:hypothetical protein